MFDPIRFLIRSDFRSDFMNAYLPRTTLYKNNLDIVKFSDELLLRIANPNVKGNKVAKRHAAAKAQKSEKTANVSSKNYKVLLDKIQDLKEPGRKLCNCLAQDKKLINNCTTCGNIVCTQEGSGPCLFCGEVVFSKEQIEFFKNDTNKAKEEKERIMNKSVEVGEEILKVWSGYHDMNFFITKPEMFRSARMGVSAGPKSTDHLDTTLDEISREKDQKAIAHKNKLINYDKTHAKRTTVVDSQQDYYKSSESTWLSKEERASNKKLADAAHKNMHKSRLDHSITIDFMGQTVVDDEDEEDRLRLLQNKFQEELLMEKNKSKGLEVENALGNVEKVAPVYVNKTDLTQLKENRLSRELKPKISRLQDSDFNTFIGNNQISNLSTNKKAPGGVPQVDSDKCLAMHQPWASLLIKGIKIHEGRTWPTNHRGFLWISSGSKKIEKQQSDAIIANHVKTYEELNPNPYGTEPDIQDLLPEEYPVGMLLGRVWVEDCLDQESYRKKFPNALSISPFVLICKEPEKLEFPIPLSSDHKIFSLDSAVLEAASVQLS